MDYQNSIVILTITSSGYATGDYCRVYSNGGSGAVSYTLPHDYRKHELTGTTITVHTEVTTVGTWTFGVRTFDSIDNAQVAATTEESQFIDLVPQKPDIMTVSSYNKTTDILILTLT